jgi:integral membrane protein (TIGR00529 family)
MLLFYQLKIPLGFSILLGAAILTAWSGAGWEGFRYQLESLSVAHNYLLLVAIFLLLFFTEALNVTGRMDRTMRALKDRFSSMKFLMGGMPALVGLLPMPGGALFSAPMVNSVDVANEISPCRKAAVNYWFRHVWEYWWPLYPGVLLAVKYAGIPAGVFYLIQMPFTVAAIAGGYYFLLRKIKARNNSVSGNVRLNRTAVAGTLIPIGIVVVLSMTGSMLLPHWGLTGDLPSLCSMIAGLSVALAVVFQKDGSAFIRAIGMVREKSTWYMMALVLGIQMFSAILKCPLDGNTAHTLVYQMQNEFMKLGIPIILVMGAIPFISGAVTGVAFGFVGASFPIVFALLGHSPAFHVVVATTTFAYGCGYFGMILSPMHVCLVVTNEYFKTKLYSSYRYIIMPALIVFALCLVCSGLYYTLLP